MEERIGAPKNDCTPSETNASSGNNSGCSSYFLEYSRNGGSSWQTSNSFGGLVNGTPYTVIARAVLPGTCGTAGNTYRSGNSAPVTQTPYGPLVQPTMNASLSGNRITWTWSTNRSDDGRPGWSASVTGECAGQSSGYSVDYGYSSGTRTCTITISAPGQVSKVASDGASTPNPPARTISTSKGVATGVVTGCSSGSCNRVNISGANFAPNVALEVHCGGDTPGKYYALTTTDSSGSFGSVQSACFHASGVPQGIFVRETNNTANEASVTSNW